MSPRSAAFSFRLPSTCQPPPSRAVTTPVTVNSFGGSGVDDGDGEGDGLLVVPPLLLPAEEVAALVGVLVGALCAAAARAAAAAAASRAARTLARCRASASASAEADARTR